MDDQNDRNMDDHNDGKIEVLEKCDESGSMDSVASTLAESPIVQELVKKVLEVSDVVIRTREVSTILVNTAISYEATAQTAQLLNTIALAHKDDVKKALARTRKIGRILDRVIKVSRKQVKKLEEDC